MSLDSASQLADILGDNINNQSTISQNLNPDDSSSQFLLFFSEGMKIQNQLVISAKTIATDSFVLDHPVYGYLNSPTLQLDGGYTPTVEVATESAFFKFDDNLTDSSSSGVTLESRTSSLRFVSTYVSGSNPNKYCYWKVKALSYTVQAGDVLKFDQYVPSSNIDFEQGIEIDTTTSYMRAYAVVDQNGVSPRVFPSGSINQWYSRTFSNFGTLMAGQVLTFLDLVDETNSTNPKTSYFKNIRIEDGSGNIRYEIFRMHIDGILNTDNYSADKTGNIDLYLLADTSSISYSSGVVSNSIVQTTTNALFFNPALVVPRKFSFACWFKYPLISFHNNDNWNTFLRGVTSCHYAIVKRNSTSPYNNHLGMYDNLGGTGFNSCGFDMSTLSSGWHHLIVTVENERDLNVGITKFYIDNTYVGCAYKAGYGADGINTLAGYATGVQQVGQLDEFRIYDFILTSEQRSELYYGTGIITSLNIDEPVPTVIYTSII